MKNNIILIITFCFGFLSCTKEKINPTAIYNINFDDRKFIDVENLVSDVEIIELDTAQTALIPVISKISVYKDRIYCFCPLIGGYVKVYTLDGHYLFKIHHIGRAENEWIDLCDMHVNEQDEIVTLTDLGSKKVLQYGLDGTFVRALYFNDNLYRQVISHNGYFYAMASTSSATFQLTNNAMKQMDIYDNKGRFISKKIPVKHDGSRILQSRQYDSFYKGSSGLLVTPTLDDTIYLIEGTEVVPFAKFVYSGKKPFLIDDDLKEAIEQDNWLNGRDKTFYEGAIIETPDLIIRRLGWYNAIDVIYNKKTGKAVTTQFDNPSLQTHHFSEKFLFQSPLYYNNGYFYSAVALDFFELPKEYIQNYIPSSLKEIENRAKCGKLNNIILRYKIRTDF